MPHVTHAQSASAGRVRYLPNSLTAFLCRLPLADVGAEMDTQQGPQGNPTAPYNHREPPPSRVCCRSVRELCEESYSHGRKGVLEALLTCRW